MHAEFSPLPYLDKSQARLIVLPTTACNFNCTYCYQDHAPKHMKPEMVEALMKFIGRRIENGLRFLNIEFFGGEPTLGLNQVVLPLSRYANSAGIEYHGSMTTNFYRVDLPTLRSLVEAGVKSYQVTLDGPRDLHDRSRLRVDGAGTFDRVFGNLMAAHESDLDFEIMIRLHYTPENWERIAEFAQKLVSILGADKRFRLHFHPITKLGGKNDDAIQETTKDEKDYIESQLRSRVPEHMHARIRRETYVCYACTSSLAFAPDGTIYKCTVCLENDSNHIGRLLPDGRLDIDQELHRAWLAPLFLGEEARQCPYRWLRENVKGFDCKGTCRCAPAKQALTA